MTIGSRIVCAFHTHWPVVVEMAKFVAQSLNVVWFQTRRVPNHIKVRRSYRPLTNTLAHKEEVIPNNEKRDSSSRTH